MSVLPIRPRLADHTRARRHIVTRDDGVEELVAIHDPHTAEVVHLPPREWSIVACADGTRDLDAIALAAARAGVYRRFSELEAIFGALHARGLLADGIASPLPASTASTGANTASTGDATATPTPSDRPLAVLPGLSLICDRSGTCCTQYGSIAFDDAEAARARVHVPGVLDGLRAPERVFLPLASGVPCGFHAVTMIDGACAYLDAHGSCAIHAAAGPEAKPRPCLLYPRTYVDDGVHVRVSVKVECPCVLESARTAGTTGEPLVAVDVRVRGDLDPAAVVRVLPTVVRVTSTPTTAPREALAAWSAAIVDCEVTDAAAACLRLAETLERSGLDVAASCAAVADATPLSPSLERELHRWLTAAAARARQAADTADAWRGTGDRVRAQRRVVADAAMTASNAAMTASNAAHAADEWFYVRAAIFGHQHDPAIAIADALRDRAVRIVIARAITERAPLAIVEATMRHGVDAYVADALQTRP